MLIRLNKFLAESGCCSRRKADEFILAGKVIINGEITKSLGVKIDPEKDEVQFDGKLLVNKPKLVYYALYKPKGIVSSAEDEQGRKTVTDFVPRVPRVYPIGRLDTGSEGLIILTNDGELTQELTHPSFEHEKEYEVTVKSQKQKAKSAEEIKSLFEKGLLIEGHLMKADSVSSPQILNTKYLSLTIVLHTGYNRQIRKMFAKIGYDVTKLIRTRVGKLRLSDLDLKSGEFKKINRAQIIQ